MSSRVIAATTSAGSAPDQGHTTVGTGLARLPNHCHNFDQLSSIVSTPARGPVIHGAPNGRGAATCAAPSADLRCIAAQRLGLALGWWCDRGRTSMEYEGSARCRGRGPCGPVPVRRRTPACRSGTGSGSTREPVKSTCPTRGSRRRRRPERRRPPGRRPAYLRGPVSSSSGPRRGARHRRDHRPLPGTDPGGRAAL
jgi:hypothetical protein